MINSIILLRVIVKPKKLNFNTYVMLSLIMTGTTSPYTVCLLDTKEPEKWAPLMEEHKCMTMFFYSAQFMRFLSQKSFKTANLSEIKIIMSAGGPVTPEMHKKAKEMFAEHHPRKGACGKSPFPVIKAGFYSFLYFTTCCTQVGRFYRAFSPKSANLKML